MVTKSQYKLAGRQNTPRAKMRVIPDQSLSIKEIVRRFTKGLPVDVKQREGVYLDQTGESEIDYEKLSRMDFADKVEFARQWRETSEQRYNEMQARIDEAKRKEDERVSKERAAKSTPPPKQEVSGEDTK